MLILKILSKIVKFFHAVFIGALWLSPLYIIDPILLICAIACQTLILFQFEITDNRCIVTMLEYYLEGKHVDFSVSNPSSAFNKGITMLIGKNRMINLNLYIPYFVILGICIKLFFVL